MARKPNTQACLKTNSPGTWYCERDAYSALTSRSYHLMQGMLAIAKVLSRQLLPVPTMVCVVCANKAWALAKAQLKIGYEDAGFVTRILRGILEVPIRQV